MKKVIPRLLPVILLTFSLSFLFPVSTDAAKVQAVIVNDTNKVQHLVFEYQYDTSLFDKVFSCIRKNKHKKVSKEIEMQPCESVDIFTDEPYVSGKTIRMKGYRSFPLYDVFERGYSGEYKGDPFYEITREIRVTHLLREK